MLKSIKTALAREMKTRFLLRARGVLHQSFVSSPLQTFSLLPVFPGRDTWVLSVLDVQWMSSFR